MTFEQNEADREPLDRAALFIAHKQKGVSSMAVKLIGTYAKKLGLPGYSSHQFSVSV